MLKSAKVHYNRDSDYLQYPKTLSQDVKPQTNTANFEKKQLSCLVPFET